MGSPFNVISSKLVEKLSIPPNIAHNKEYGTAGMVTAKVKGVYSYKPIIFVSVQVIAPAVVLNNVSYYFIIETSFFRKYQVNTFHMSNMFTIKD